MPSETAVEVEAVAAAEVVAVVVGAETAEAAEVVIKTKTNSPSRLGEDPSTKGQSTRICQPGIGPDVVCISVGGVPPFSVPNRAHVHGKMSSPPNNEPVTNSVIQT